MKEQGLRYFSSLTSVQKDKTIFNILALKHGLTQLPEGLVKQLLFEINDKEVDEKMKKTKDERFSELESELNGIIAGKKDEYSSFSNGYQSYVDAAKLKAEFYAAGSGDCAKQRAGHHRTERLCRLPERGSAWPVLNC